METYFGAMGENAGAISRAKLTEDLKTLSRDAEGLFKATAGEVAEKMSEEAKAARSRLAGALERAMSTCRELEEKAITGAKAADRTIRAHPYESVGLAFGLGLLIGVLATRK